MLINDLEKIRKNLNKKDSFIYKDDEYYYIMCENEVDNCILFKEEEQTILHYYEIKGFSREQLLNIIIENIDNDIVIPNVDTEEEIELLKQNGFCEVKYDDPVVDEEIKNCPSFILQKQKIVTKK